MKISVYTRGGNQSRPPRMLWHGFVDCLPRVGDDVCYNDDFANETVRRVTHNLHERSIRVELECWADDD